MGIEREIEETRKMLIFFFFFRQFWEMIQQFQISLSFCQQLFQLQDQLNFRFICLQIQLGLEIWDCF